MKHEFCLNERIPDKSLLWSHDFYDSQLEIRTIVAKSKRTPDLYQLQRAAMSLAQQHFHRGFSFGVCDDRRALVVTTPSSEMIATEMKSQLRFKLNKVSKSCRSIRVDYAAAWDGETKVLYRWPKKHRLSKEIFLELKFLAPGTISMTCRPKGKNKGSELWALYPVHGALSVLPAKTLLGQDTNSLKSWVNELRIREGLIPLDDQNRALSETGYRLSQSLSIRHDRVQLKKEKTFLKKHRIRFLGENRVKAESTKDMAWLLWNSPRHRSLLMNPHATHFSLSEAGQKNMSLAVLVFR